MKKILIGLLGITVLLGSFSGCFLFKKNAGDLGLESFLPKNSAVVFVLDHTSDTQIANLKEFSNKFPDRADLKKFIGEEYGKSNIAKEFPYDDFKAIFSGKWKVAFAAEGEYMMLAIEPENAEDFQKFLEALMADGSNKFVKTEGEKGIIYWQDDNAKAFIARYGEIFLIANDKDKFNKSIEDAESGDGFGDESFVAGNLKELGEDNFGYAYGNMEKLVEFNKQFEGEFPLFVDNYSAKIMEDSFVVFSTDGRSVKFLGKSYLSDEGKKEDISRELSFVNKVPVWKPILYIEDYPASRIIQTINDSLQTTPNPVDLFQKLAGLIETDAEVFKKFLNSPFAFVISDSGMLYPTISFYMQVSEENMETAKKFSGFITNYIEIFAKQFGENLGSADLVKKDVVTFEGGAISKFFTDWKALPADGLAELNAAYQGFTGNDEGQDITNFKLELYSGITGDGLFVVSLYPNFVEDFGEILITDDEDYMAFLPEVKDYYGNGGFYFLSGKNFGSMAARYLSMAKFAGAVSADDYMMFEKIIDFVSRLRSIVASQYVGKESVKQILYFGTDGMNVDGGVVTESGAVTGSGESVEPEKMEKEKVKR